LTDALKEHAQFADPSKWDEVAPPSIEPQPDIELVAQTSEPPAYEAVEDVIVCDPPSEPDATLLQAWMATRQQMLQVSRAGMFSLSE
jgi:hypothetical protein